MKTVLILAFLILYQLGNAQLIDNFGKIVTHEINLTKQDDGTYIGAIEWTTGSIDSLQRYVISDLDIKAPMMVTIISKAPKHNIDLTFHKNNWETHESKISTNGEKFADKIFRTKNTLGLGVSSQVGNIPYLITVKVGLQFPSTQSLIRLTDDKEEYSKHLRSLGFQDDPFGGSASTVSNASNATGNSSTANNKLLYIIIALLAVIAILFTIFLIRKKSSKITMLLFCCLGLSQFVMSQSATPHNIPAGEQPAVFTGYVTHYVPNQVPYTTGDSGVVQAHDRDARVSHDGGQTYQPVSLRPNQGSIELSGDEITDIERRMREDREQFDRDYVDDMPGQDTDGAQRVLPADRDAQELDRLRRQVRRLQADVDRLLADGDVDEEEDTQDQEILIYCESRQECLGCMLEHIDTFNKHHAYFQYLQKYYRYKSKVLNDYIAWGNSMSNLPGGGGIGWTSILLNKVRPSMEEMRTAYDNKFDDYIESMELDLDSIGDCSSIAGFISTGGYESSISQLIQSLKASRISD